MKASELRIGNRITQIIYKDTHDEEKEILVDWQEIWWISKNTKSYRPIILTKKRLVDFGFEEVLNGYYKKGFLILNSNFEPIFTDGNYIDEVIGVKIDFIHQLQNLYFALNGEELTLNQ